MSTSTGPAHSQSSRLLGASAVMAAGTVFSRLSGWLRSVLIVMALGATLHGEIFAIANTLPNMIYILVAGGVFNAVLVPQLVRAMGNDPDGGESYTNRIITLAALFLGAVTVLLVVAAPWIAGLYLQSSWDAPSMTAQRESVVAFSRYCLPQVFFYGMYVLVGQVLNARGRFGPMMWAPIANNVIAVGVLLVYLLVFGPAAPSQLRAGFSPGQEALLGLGSTAGIAMQFFILVPYLRSTGFVWRPRFDFRNTGLGHTLRLGLWTVLTVVANQIAYLTIVWLASGGTVDDPNGTGYLVYSNTFLIVMVPHAIVTVSLATAALPRLSELARDDQLRELGETVSTVLRTTLVAVLLVAAVLPVVASDVALANWDWFAGKGGTGVFVPSLRLFPIGLIFFTIHYLMLRGFYALEQTRTVFFIQCVIACVNMVAAFTLVSLATPAQTAPALVAAYTLAYLVGAVVSATVLRRQCGSLDGSALAKFLTRYLPVVFLTALLAIGLNWLLGLMADQPPPLVAAARALVVVGVSSTFALVLAKALQVTEVTEVTDAVIGKLGGRRRRSAR